MKSGTAIKNTIFLLCINAMLFFGLGFLHRPIYERPIATTILVFIILAVKSAWIIGAFVNNFNFRLNLKRDYKKFLISLGLCLLLEIILNTVINIPFTYRYFFCDLIVIAIWFLIYFLFTSKNKSIKKKSIILISITVSLLILIFGFLYTRSLRADCSYAISKYTDSYPPLKQLIKNSEFLFFVKLFIVEFVIELLFLIIHIISLPKEHFQKDEKPYTYSKAKRIYATYIRCFIILFATLAFYIVFALFSTGNTLTFHKLQSSSTTAHESQNKMNSYEVNKGFFSTSMFPPTINDALYLYKTVKLSKPSVKQEIFNFTGLEQQVIYASQINKLSECVHFEIGENDVYVYDNFAIAYYENGKPYIVRIEDIKSHKYSEQLLGALKLLLLDGNVFAFEHGSKYMLKYDSDFIKPYIERYANGSFNLNEKKWLDESFYRQEYIAKLAKKLNN